MKFELNNFETALRNEILRLQRILAAITENPADESAVRIHSGQAVGVPKKRRTNTLTAKCGVWLLSFLRKGPQSAKTVLAAAEKLGFKEDTLKTASQRAGIKKVKVSQRDGHGPWRWSLE
jgi:hypothetical protein